MRLAQANVYGFARVKLQIEADIPSKKNKLRPGKTGYHYDKETKAQIEAIVTQLSIQWGPRPACSPSRVEVRIAVFNTAKDRDGIWTTLIDAMKRSGIIHDDAVRSYNPHEEKPPVTKSELLALDQVVIILDFPTNEKGAPA